MPRHDVTSRAQWLEARRALLTEEKAWTRAYDRLMQQRRALPWVEVDKSYVFESADGPVTLADLFDGRSQLIVQHFMFAPGWGEGCVGCSFKSDHADAAVQHLEHHDVTFVSVSRAPLAEIAAFKRRMGWRFKWVSSYGNDFNYDFGVSFRGGEASKAGVQYNYATRPFDGEEGSGDSVFYKDERGTVFHTYSTFGRGDETLVTAYMYLDLTPNGRNETGPRFNLMDWVHHHDRYEPAAGAGGEAPCHCHEVEDGARVVSAS